MSYPQQRNKLAFALKSLGPSDLAFNLLMRSMDTSMDGWDISLFWLQLDRPCCNHLSFNAHIHELSYFDGPAIATCLETANKLINCPNLAFKFFFIEDLEWLRIQNKNYHQLEYIYRNPQFKLLCRSHDHKKLIESAWNVKVDFVIDNYNFFTKDFLDFVKSNTKYLYDNRPKYFKKELLNIKALNI